VRIGYDATLLRGEPAGVEGTVAALLRALLALESGDEFVVYCGRRFRPPEWLARPNVRLRRMVFDSAWRLARIFWQQLRLPWLANADRLDVFHGPAYVIPAWMGVPAVLGAADAIALSHPELCRKSTVAHLRRFLPRSCRLARRVVAPSRASAEALARFAGADERKICVVPHGIGAEFRPTADRALLARVRESLRLPGRFALFVGQLEPKKNLVRLVRAFYAAISHLGLDHKLLVVGKPGWRWREVGAEVRNLGMAETVLFTGYLPGAVLPYIYGLAEALLLPSIVEGFGLPALEAAACGTPVLTSRDPALLEVVGEAGLAVEASSLPALREGIERTLTDRELRARLAAAGPQRAAQFTWERAARATLEIHRQVLAEDRREMDDLNRRTAGGSGGA
jgi:glycosyltransferase involved in cell wall biosynthesis